MKKKLIIIFSIAIVSIIILLTIVFTIPDKKQKIELTNFEGTTLELGEYKVKSYKKEKYANKIEQIEFLVDDVNDFYNTMIKNNSFYVKELDFNINNYYAYGFFVENNSFFNYKIMEKTVYLEASFGMIGLYNEIIKEYDNYYFNGPITYGVSPDINDTIYSDVSFEQFERIISYSDKNSYKIIEDEIYIKGIEIEDKKTYTNDYIIIFYEENNEIKMRRNYE